jgi:hypothetical protein
LYVLSASTTLLEGFGMVRRVELVYLHFSRRCF